MNNNSYQKFLKDNSSVGYLKIRAYAASEAIPIMGLKVIVSKEIDNKDIVFFEGTTDESGVIEKITLPAPPLKLNNLTAPDKATYKITAIYDQDNFKEIFNVNIYEEIWVMQNIVLVPNKINNRGDF